jgi:uncharacterized RDD family membrane protein YckC
VDPGALDTVTEIETPEHLAFRTRLAGPSRRLLAWLLDGLVWLALLCALLLITYLVTAAGLEGVDRGLLLLGVFALWWGYFFAAEMLTGGRSVGKQALSLRVVRSDGLPITWRASLLRNLLRAADLALYPPLVLGPLVMAWDPRFRRLGDLAADTLVVVEERARVEAPPEVPVDEALVKGLPPILSLDRSELEALELFAARGSIGPARLRELAEMVAPLLAERHGLAPPEDPTAFLHALWARARRGRLGDAA